MIFHDCIICKKKTSLVLFPDYTASGLWCLECGISHSNPHHSLSRLPQELIRLIEGWVELWDFASCAYPDEINKKYFEQLVLDMGIELNKQINQYYVCSFFMDDCKLDNPPRVNRQTGKWEHE